MQTDVLASVPLTTSGQFTNQATDNIQRCRIKAIYVVPTGTAGTLIIKDGGSGGAILATLNTVASATQPTYIVLPGEGILSQLGPYGAVSTVGSATIFYA